MTEQSPAERWAATDARDRETVLMSIYDDHKSWGEEAEKSSKQGCHARATAAQEAATACLDAVVLLRREEALSPATARWRQNKPEHRQQLLYFLSEWIDKLMYREATARRRGFGALAGRNLGLHGAVQAALDLLAS